MLRWALVAAIVVAFAGAGCQSTQQAAPVAASHHAGRSAVHRVEAPSDAVVVAAYKSAANRAGMRARAKRLARQRALAYACRPIPGANAIIVGSTVAECAHNRAMTLAKIRQVDGPGPDTPLERSCVGHEDSLRCAGVEQRDVARHWHATHRDTPPPEMSRDQARRIWEQRRDYFRKHPPHRATHCPPGQHPVGVTGACG